MALQLCGDGNKLSLKYETSWKIQLSTLVDDYLSITINLGRIKQNLVN